MLHSQPALLKMHLHTSKVPGSKCNTGFRQHCALWARSESPGTGHSTWLPARTKHTFTHLAFSVSNLAIELSLKLLTALTPSATVFVYLPVMKPRDWFTWKDAQEIERIFNFADKEMALFKCQGMWCWQSRPPKRMLQVRIHSSLVEIPPLHQLACKDALFLNGISPAL